MSQGITSQQFAPLDFSLLNPGLIVGGGIDQSKSRFSITQLQGWNILNLEPVRKGWSNRQIGMTKLNSSRLVNAKVQCIFVFNNTICFVVGGDFYTMGRTGGIPTLATGGAGAFDTTARVRMAFNQGTLVNKAYLCDGISTPKAWDGSSLTVLTTLTSVADYTPVNNVYQWRGRNVWSFVKDSINENRLVISKQNDADDYTFTATTVLDAIDTYVLPGDGDYINGIGAIKIKGDTAQTEALVACKSRQAFLADDLSFAGTTVSAVFNRTGVDIECLNPDCVIGFLNDLWIMGSTGIKGFKGVQGQDGVSSLVQSSSLPVDNLIIESSKSSNFSNAFIKHFATLRKIWIFLPKDDASSITQYSFVYPEVPNDFTLCYNYGITEYERNIISAWYTRGGAGWAIPCATEDAGKILVGSYFGDIYEIDLGNGSNDYEPLVSDFGGTYYDTQDNIVAAPTLAQRNQPIMSEWETGDWTFGNYNQDKRLQELRTLFYSERSVVQNFEIYYNGDADGISYLNKNSSSTGTGNSGVWDVSFWDEAVWGGEFPQFIKIRPVGHGRSVRIRLDFNSKILNETATGYNNNYITLYGLSGRVQLGGDILN